MLRVSSLVAAALVLAAPVGAQVRRDPGVMIGDKVVVRVYAVLSDASTPYHPLESIEFRFYRSAHDSVVARTNDAGILTTLLAPGEWRLVSLMPIEWKGQRYRWSMPVSVREWMPAIELSIANADPLSGEAAVAVIPLHAAQAERRDAQIAAPTSTPTEAAMPRRAADGTVAMPKDATVAVIVSLFLTGGGHLYAGETGKGVGLLLGSVLGWGAMIAGASQRANDCGGYSDCSSSGDYPLLAGAGIWLGTWIYGLVDSAGAVHRHNRTLGYIAQRVRPVVAKGASGSTRAGLSLGF